MARYAQIRSTDISDGPGIRTAIYFQGCPIRCPGCHNESIWDFKGGTEFTIETIEKVIELSNNDTIVGLSILGGEPLAESNIDATIELSKTFKHIYPKKTIWLWTGYLFENLLNNKKFKELCKYVDVIVDGPWKQELYDWKLLYRGSSNQRVIDISKSIKKKKVIEIERLTN